MCTRNNKRSMLFFRIIVEKSQGVNPTKQLHSCNALRMTLNSRFTLLSRKQIEIYCDFKKIPGVFCIAAA